MNQTASRWTGVGNALLAAALFGASTPLAKAISPHVEPVLMAGLLYLGSGLGLAAYAGLRAGRKRTGPQEAALTRKDVPWLAGAILAGGVIGPVLLMWGLAITPASSASLLLNLEGVLTALLAWFVFRENFDARIALGMALIAAGGICLAWLGQPVVGVPWGALAIAGACLAFTHRTPNCQRRRLRYLRGHMRMKHPLLPVALLALGLAAASAQVPDNLVVEGIPPLTPELKRDVGRYLEFRSAGLSSWHPQRREMLISTRFADANQLHLVKQPGGARKQITFFPEPVAGGSFQPITGNYFVFAQDTGGGEFYQLYRFDLADARVTLLTDGKARNMGGAWSTSGKQIAYTSTRRTGKDNDIWVMDPADPKSDRQALELTGGGWAILDWSPDDTKLLLEEGISINESYLWLADLETGTKELLTAKGAEKIAWGPAAFAKDGKSLFLVSDQGTEFKQLYRMNLATKALQPLAANLKGDVEDFDLSDDGKLLAFVTNEDGASRLSLLNAATGKALPVPKLPLGVIGGLQWHKNNRDLGFTLSAAQSPSDVYSLDVKSGKVERWTESETGGLEPATFVEPELVRIKSFDGLEFSAFVYRPDAKKFSGPRPVLINIHGGPEGQSRPIFQSRNNYILNELGVAVIYPNVRGSDGYGKTFLTLDNGFKREDSVKDIGALLDWIATQPSLSKDRVAVIGGSYGGYMVLACMTHFSDRLRSGVDIVGISNFLTFLKNTQDYRRDLRRVEYGDERDPAMAEHLAKISPTASVSKITKPLLVVQGLNDPRVPVTEAEQMVKAIRDQGGTAWYLMAKDEGHGFAKKRNADFMFYSVIQFLQQTLLK